MRKLVLVSQFERFLYFWSLITSASVTVCLIQLKQTIKWCSRIIVKRKKSELIRASPALFTYLYIYTTKKQNTSLALVALPYYQQLNMGITTRQLYRGTSLKC